MNELLSTKLFVPRPRTNLVSRPHLIDRLNGGLERKLTLIAAPAGFGKSTLLSEWIPKCTHCVTWLALDDGDNDSIQFWSYFIASLQGLYPQLGESALALLQSPQTPPIPHLLTGLINEIAAFPDTFSVVLEDYHVIDARPIHDALVFLLDHLPVNMHLILTTRVDPPLPLARLRARDELIEIRANDLRFTAGEAAAFLTQSMGLALSEEEIAALEARTEGWIAGLQIAALSMQGQDDIPGFIQTFSGSHRHILGYLAEEVINQRPNGTLDFLLQTSILDRLCGPLCDAVTGESGGQATLENLERANLFLIPLDDKGMWYRYHSLFAEVLRARLKQTHGDRVLEFHRRAGNWHARQGLNEEAVRHALAGADYEGAARLIEGVAGNMLRQGAGDSLAAWLAAMPEETIHIRPRLCLARGWAYFMGSAFSLEKADEWAQLALQIANADGSLDSSLTGEVAALQAMIAATRGEIARSSDLSLQALDDLPLDNPWRTAIVFCLGTAHYLSGDMAAAAPVFEEAIRLSQAGKEHYVQLAAASFLGEIRVIQGLLSRAMEMYQQVLAWTDHGPPQKGVIMAHAGLADILCEQDQLDAALAHIQFGFEQVDQVGGAYSSFVLYRVLARIQQAQGNWKDALDSLDRAYKMGQSAQVSLVVTQAAALRARLQLAQGDLRSAETWVDDSGLSLDDAEASKPGWREVEYLTLARVLAAQVRHAEAYSLLNRLLLSAEAEGRNGSVIAILALQCSVTQMQGDTARALRLLEHALTLAEPEGYLRVFVDEGEPMRVLLEDFRLALPKSAPDKTQLVVYVDRLLSAYAIAGFESMLHRSVDRSLTWENLVDPLSERELEVLHLINDGLTNQEIADRLVIAVSTVKTHINHLYGKFGARNRIQAVANARNLGLLSNASTQI